MKKALFLLSAIVIMLTFAACGEIMDKIGSLENKTAGETSNSDVISNESFDNSVSDETYEISESEYEQLCNFVIENGTYDDGDYIYVESMDEYGYIGFSYTDEEELYIMYSIESDVSDNSYETLMVEMSLLMEYQENAKSLPVFFTFESSSDGDPYTIEATGTVDIDEITDDSADVYDVSVSHDFPYADDDTIKSIITDPFNSSVTLLVAGLDLFLVQNTDFDVTDLGFVNWD